MFLTSCAGTDDQELLDAYHTDVVPSLVAEVAEVVEVSAGSDIFWQSLLFLKLFWNRARPKNSDFRFILWLEKSLRLTDLLPFHFAKNEQHKYGF